MNLDGYGPPTIHWARVKDVLDSPLTQAPGTGGPDRHTAWLTTINPDGSPHVMPLGVVRLNGNWYFTSGPGIGNQAIWPETRDAWSASRRISLTS